MFQDEFYRPKDGVAEYAEAPLRTAHSVTAQPHLPMNELATADTRIRRMVRVGPCGAGRGLLNRQQHDTNPRAPYLMLAGILLDKPQAYRFGPTHTFLPFLLPTHPFPLAEAPLRGRAGPRQLRSRPAGGAGHRQPAGGAGGGAPHRAVRPGPHTPFGRVRVCGEVRGCTGGGRCIAPWRRSITLATNSTGPTPAQ